MELIATIESDEKRYDDEQLQELGIDYNSTEEEILEAMTPVLEEETGFDIMENGVSLYAVKKIESTNNIFLMPKSPAGTLK